VVLALVGTGLATPGSGISTDNVLFSATALPGRYDAIDAKAETDSWELELKVKDLTTFTPCATRSNRIRTGPARSPLATRAGRRTPGPA
jgi:hypothetical protein